jgi:hypothetical protein
MRQPIDHELFDDELEREEKRYSHWPLIGMIILSWLIIVFLGMAGIDAWPKLITLLGAS